MPLLDSVVDSVANTNFKTVGESVAFYSSMAMGDSVAHQRRVNAISEAALAKAVQNLTEVDLSESIATKQMTTGNAAAENATALGAAVAALQQLIKTAQTTPPVTAGT